MGVVFPTGYAKPYGDYSLKCARILHSGVWLTGGTITATTAATGYTAAAADNSLTYERYKPASVPASWAYDRGGAVVCDCACIGAHTLGTSGATVALQAFVGASWTTIASVTPEDDMPIMFIFAPVIAQEWRVYITTAAAEIGVVKFGQALQMPQIVDYGHTPLHMARRVVLTTNGSETGETLGRSLRRTSLATSFSWRNITDAWTREVWRSVQTAIATEPFFIAWRPETWPEVALAHVSELPIPVETGERYRSQMLYALEMQVTAHAWD